MEDIFEIYEEKVNIKLKSGKDVTLTLRPLSGAHLAKLFKLSSKMGELQEGAMTDEGVITDLHLLVKETLKKSYPEQDEKKLDEFATQNLFALIDGLVKVNMNNNAM